VRDREPDERQNRVARTNHHACGAVDDRRSCVRREPRAAGEHLFGDCTCTCDRRPSQRAFGSRIGAEDDVRIEHRDGLLDDSSGLHTIWKLSDPASMAVLSLGVVALFAALLTTVAIRAFKRAAVS
jgi:hypothetical protein